MTSTPVFLNALATANPAYVLDQAAVTAECQKQYDSKDAISSRTFARLAPAFTNAGIDQRYSVVDLDWFRSDKNWAQRNAVYQDKGADLYIDCVTKALAQANIKASELDILVTVSSTGITTPSLEAIAADRLGLPTNALRVPVFGLGCAGGVSGMAIAVDLARANPGANVLLVALELCTLSFRTDRDIKSDIIATALFGDGAAAVILSTSESSITQAALHKFTQHRWPDTLGIMGWSVDSIGLGAIFSRSIPDLIQTRYREVVDVSLDVLGTSLEDIELRAFHPGGTKVLESFESVLGLKSGTLEIERGVLKTNGNMSAPTVLYVFERLLQNAPKGLGLLSALGPGFTASFGTFEC